jgi:signal transduction histidine kinase
MPRLQSSISYGKKQRKKMALRFENFLHFCCTHNPANPEDILIHFVSFCREQIPGSNPTLYRHDYTPVPFTRLSDTNRKEDIIPKKLAKQHQEIYHLEHRLLIPVNNHKNKVRYALLLTPSKITGQKTFLDLIRTLLTYIKNIYYQLDTCLALQALHYANLISQVTHDFTSVLKQVELEKCILANHAYAENMLKELLFYIRDSELILSTVPLSACIDAILQEVDRPDNVEIQVNLSQKIDHLTIDVELFAKALSSLLYNAIEAAAAGKQLISLEIYKVPSQSPFIADDWIAIKISDSGMGIPADYINQIQKPFFTTRKIEGHCGFGLPNAQKIVKAHGGLLEIMNDVSGQGSSCIIYIPDRNLEK